MYSYKSGHFSDSGREYVITDRFTPRAWENYQYTLDGKFHTIITQRAKGSTFFDCPEVNNVSNGRNYVVLDRENGDCWSVNGGDAPILSEQYNCTHKPGVSIFSTSHKGLAARLECAVALEKYVEANRLVLENTTGETKKLSLIGYHSISLKGIDNRLECQRMDFSSDKTAISCERRHYRTPKYNYAAFFKGSLAADSYCGSLQDFLGSDVNFSDAMPFNSGVLSDTLAYGTEPIFAIQYDIELAAGEKKVLNFALGLAQSLDEAKQAAKDYNIDAENNGIFKQVEEFYAEFVNRYPIKTPDNVLNIMLNVWTKCQLHRQTLSARSTAWFNWRNHLQDGWAYMLFDTDWLNHWIRKTCQAQFDDGFMPRCSERVPLLKYPNQTHADIATWTALCAARYYAETGDKALFAEQITFGQSKKTTTIAKSIINGLLWLFEHTGKNGLVLMRDGDWSDPLEEVGKRDIGESPWTSMALFNAAKNFAPVLVELGFKDDAADLLARAEKLAENINKTAWDGDWYIRAITDDGERVCTSADKDGRVSLLMQSWAVISGVADSDKLQKLVKAVDENNKNNPVGPILYAPPFLTPRPWIGRETAKPPGTCVNGSCYNHVAIMWAKAEAMLGRAEESIKIIKQVLPLREQDETAITKAVPLWTPNYWHGPHSQRAGEGSDVMTSAAPPWIFLVITDYIFGVRVEIDGLHVKPCLPQDWNFASFERKYRGSYYVFDYKRVGKGNSFTVKLDGEELNDCIIKPDNVAKKHNVEILIGN